MFLVIFAHDVRQRRCISLIPYYVHIFFLKTALTLIVRASHYDVALRCSWGQKLYFLISSNDSDEGKIL
jgi:hypothetical protein